MGNENRDKFSIGEAARRSGVNAETIRYYERIRLLDMPARSAGGHRVYGAGAIERLGFVRRSRGLGFTLEQVRSLLALAEKREVSCAEVERLARAHLASVRERIADLTRMERVLAEMVARCAGGRVPDCPILEALREGV